MRLRIELEDFKGQKSFIEYDNFEIGPQGNQFPLESVGTPTGNAS